MIVGVSVTVMTGLWLGNCLAHLDRTMFLLGYIPQNNRHYLGNKTVNMMIGELPAAGVREWIQDRRHEEGLWSGGLCAAELQN